MTLFDEQMAGLLAPVTPSAPYGYMTAEEKLESAIRNAEQVRQTVTILKRALAERDETIRDLEEEIRTLRLLRASTVTDIPTLTEDEAERERG